MPQALHSLRVRIIIVQAGLQTVVSIDYTLTDSEGEILDQSEAGAPLVYLHGADNIIPGLEAALTLGRRGFEVSVAERSRQFGGRLLWEAALPGLKQWFRVVDYRLG